MDRDDNLPEAEDELGSMEPEAFQLKPENFASAAAEAGYPCQLRLQPLYDHSYYMISTFMRDHIDHHARALGLRPSL